MSGELTEEETDAAMANLICLAEEMLDWCNDRRDEENPADFVAALAIASARLVRGDDPTDMDEEVPLGGCSMRWLSLCKNVMRDMFHDSECLRNCVGEDLINSLEFREQRRNELDDLTPCEECNHGEAN